MCSPANWYQTAKRLDLNTSTVYRVVHKGGTLDNEGAFKVADLLKIPRDEVIALIEQDRAKTPEKQEFWRRHAPRLSAVAAVTVAAAAGLGPKTGLANAGAPESYGNGLGIHYAH